MTAKKWLWQFEYPDGTRTINEFTSRWKAGPHGDDHRRRAARFLRPDFRVKHDIVPGRYTKSGSPDHARDIPGFCAEYCGKDHSDMLAKFTWTTMRLTQVGGGRR